MSTLDLEGTATGTPETGKGGEGSRTATLTSVKEQGNLLQPWQGGEGRELHTVSSPFRAFLLLFCWDLSLANPKYKWKQRAEACSLRARVNLEVQREIMWLHVGEEGSEFSSEKGEFEVLRDAWMVNMQRND